MGGRGPRSSSRKGQRSSSDESQPPRRSPRFQDASVPVTSVFGQQELLEMILDYAVHDKNQDTRVKTLRSVRLVNKKWLSGVTQLMKLRNEPIFRLTMTGHNSLNGTPFVAADGKLLDQFVAAMGRRVDDPLPTFKLKFMEDFFREENHNSLATCLQLYGHGLVDLEMSIPTHGGSLSGILPPVELPALKKLTTFFIVRPLPGNLSEDERKLVHPSNACYLIQTILNLATSLTEFNNPGPATRVPIGFQYLCLPDSVTKMALGNVMKSQDLEILTRNKLPNLEWLIILLHNFLYEEGILSKVLEKFSTHLCRLAIRRLQYDGPPRHANLVRFPQMKKLDALITSNHGFELEAPCSSLGNCFPKLKTLVLYQQTPEMLSKWTSSIPISSVDTVALRLVDETKSEESPQYTLPLSLEAMQGLHYLFPNLTSLALYLLPGREENGLKFLFMNMTQLLSLEICVEGNEAIDSTDKWDSVFTGVPVPVIGALRDTDFCEKFQVKEDVPSIKMLTALRKLTLTTERDGPQSLISDFTFTFAFMKMRNLMSLDLKGRFKASDETATKWKEAVKGRQFTYSSEG